MKMDLPLISIITVTFNAVHSLEKTILSVINQTYPNIEYIIIDGGSTDGTIDLIKKYDDKISYWISEPDKGIYDAMNKGIDRALGTVIGILNAGDWYSDNIFSAIMDICINKEVIVHGNLNLYKKRILIEENVKPDLNMDHLYDGMTLFHPTYFVSKSIYEKIGKFNNENIIASDYEFTIKAYKSDVPFIYLNKVISNFDLDGISNKRAFLSFKESFRIVVKYGYPINSARISFIRKNISYWFLNTPGLNILYKLIKKSK